MNSAVSHDVPPKSRLPPAPRHALMSSTRTHAPHNAHPLGKDPASQSCFGKNDCTGHVDKHARHMMVHTRGHFSQQSLTQGKQGHHLFGQAAALCFNNVPDPLRQTLAQGFDIIVAVDIICAALETSSVLLTRFGPTLLGCRSPLIPLRLPRGYL